MRIEYILFPYKDLGMLYTRKPEVVLLNGALMFSFTKAPSGATAIFENANGQLLYRDLSKNECLIPVDFLVGEIKITVAFLNGNANVKRIVCEPICAERKDGVVLIYPSTLDTAIQIIELHKDLQAVKDDMDSWHTAHDSLDEKVNKLLDGYDFD